MLLVIVIGCTEDITQSVGPLPDETPMDHIEANYTVERLSPI